MAAPTSVFDDMDDLTAQICITLQLEDIAAATEHRIPFTDHPSDEDVALKVYVEELKAYSVLRGYEDSAEEYPEEHPEEYPKEHPKEHSEEHPEEHFEKPFEEPPPPHTLEDKPTEIEPHRPIKIALVSCAACGDRFNAGQCVTVPCNHHYCDGCLDDLFTHAMRDRTLYPPRCCRQVIPWDTIRDLVGDPLVTLFEAKKEELDDTTPVYCHDKRCSAYIKTDAEDSNRATCTTCHATTCTLCKQEVHEGACPEDEEVQKMREYAKNEGAQECARCHHLVELSTGCNHITCLCKHEFCYCCGVAWKNCPCEQWDEARLIARADDVARRRGMGGAAAAPAIAERIRRNHRDCDDDGHGFMERVDGQIMCDNCGQTQWKFIFRCYQCHIELCYRCKNNRA